ncbi:MAG: hypothetical protein GAK35_03358 [Herbaspirillum frisingense]|uniref:SIS domain-containing protein n=1 Tax=Herbaspirillum frisingense TaxID=92645 RepID=A0A7V8FUE3_9BURK|nr:MAG: hypothetical protein GAK35_03358 [Herbaspirillum frisingense]
MQDDDAPLDVAAKVADNTIAAILELRDSINAETLARVVDELRAAQRVELYGFGSGATVAEDAQQKLFSLGLLALPMWIRNCRKSRPPS